MEFLEVAKQAARIGGTILEEWGEKFTTREKSPANLVTEADIASQKAIFDFIHAQYPDHGFLGEEELFLDPGDSPFCWIIDPLDGTSNYVHRFPYYSVSIGLQRDGELIAGVVYDPNRDEMFAARRGTGATLNEKPIRVSLTEPLNQAMCVASLPTRADRNHPSVLRFVDMLEAAQTVQRTGSAALNFCCVACGRIDAFWSTSLHPWDMAAGVLIVEEAGGRVTKVHGGPFVLNDADVLASNGQRLHDEIIERFSSGD